MENFIYNDEFHHDLETLIDLEFSPVEELPNDFEIEIELTEERPIFVFDSEKILKAIPEDCFDEDNYETQEKNINKALNQCIDFDKLNSMLPRMWYGSGKKIKLNKSDLLNY